MTDALTLPETQAAALIADIEHQVSMEAGALIESAEQEAARLIAQAFRLARTRAAEAIAALRRDGARQRAEVEAQIETQKRIAEQALAAKALDKALPMLADALVERWQNAAARDVWAVAAARCVRERLRGGTARVEHPPLWDAAGQSRFLAELDGKFDAPGFTCDETLSAGLRIRVAGALVDATPRGLMWDAMNVRGMLLAEMSAGRDISSVDRPGGQP
jgi:F0F1-type ATP synthase membrane subunit b/b'